MIARGPRARSGITLTEILIAILIMGVGLISLATLFPLGLIRLREATRYSRAGLAFETAADDMDTRSLFYKPSFTQTWYWTVINKVTTPRDPFVQDSDSVGNIGDGTVANGIISSGSSLIPNNNVGLTSGLPFCYDPLWRDITGIVPQTGGLSSNYLDYQATYSVGKDEARFGDGSFNGVVPYLRADPQGGTPSAYGLQRLTNFIPWSTINYAWPYTCNNFSLTAPNAQPADVVGNIFTSIDDIVFNAFNGTAIDPVTLNKVKVSSVLPDMSSGNAPQADYRFTWFITGRQTDAGGNGTQFVGEVVVCDGRPFGFDPLPGQTVNAPSGETVVEAIYGYGSNVSNINASGTGFAQGANKTVLLRWPNTQPDPQVRVGGWICDVTYERNTQTYITRANNTGTTFVRCYWYQIGKRSDPQADALPAAASPNHPYRSMVLTLTSPVRAQTLLSSTTGLPYHLNVALIMPSVINVYPRAFEVH